MNKNTNMNMDEVREILDQEMEQTLPAGNVRLWASLEKNIQEDNGTLFRSREMMGTETRTRKIRYAFAVGVLAVLMAVVLVTPQGQTFAQNLLGFFRRSEGTAFPVEPIPENIAEQGSSSSADAPELYQSIAEVEEALGFSPGELTFTPEGLQYLGVRVEEDTVYLEYQGDSGGSSLIISQSLVGYYQSEWDEVPVDAVQTVQIGENAGEYVKGGFVVLPGEDEAVWNPDVPLARLRWKDAGIWIQITKMGETGAEEYPDQDALIDLAESIQFD